MPVMLVCGCSTAQQQQSRPPCWRCVVCVAAAAAVEGYMCIASQFFGLLPALHWPIASPFIGLLPAYSLAYCLPILWPFSVSGEGL